MQSAYVDRVGIMFEYYMYHDKLNGIWEGQNPKYKIWRDHGSPAPLVPPPMSAYSVNFHVLESNTKWLHT